MADISIWVHGPEFGSAIVQVAVLQEILKKRPDIKVDINVVEKNKPILDYYFSDQIKRRRFCVRTNKLVHQLGYTKTMDLSLLKTSALVSKNLFSNAVPLIRDFRNRVYKKSPKLLVSAGLAEVGILSKFLKNPKPATVYIFNYLLEYDNFFKSKVLSDISRKIFLKNYMNYDNSIIYTFFPGKNYGIRNMLNNLHMTNLIVRKKTESKAQVRKKLGVMKKEKLVFLAMGGAEYFDAFVKISSDIAKDYPDIRFLLLPREQQEIYKFKKLGNFVVPSEITYDTQNYAMASDIVITKCGLSTIAESISGNTNIISVHLPTHAEVTETENLLKKKGIIKNSIDFSVFKDEISAKKALCRMILEEFDNKQSLMEMKKIKTNGAEQAAKLYLDIMDRSISHNQNHI